MFETFTAIGLLIVFLVPGYVWRWLEGQFVYLDHRLPWEKFALGLLARSTFIYLPFLPWIHRGWNEKWHQSHPIPVTLAAIGFIAALPAALGLLTGVARQKDWIGCVFAWRWVDWIVRRAGLKTFRAHRVPTAWEAVFNSRMKPAWVVVTRKNGEQVRGLLGEQSHISVDPEHRDLFISQTLYWDERAGKYAFVPGTRGVYISADEIGIIELIDYVPPAENDHEPEQ
jgi:hypothetical protein